MASKSHRMKYNARRKKHKTTAPISDASASTAIIRTTHSTLPPETVEDHSHTPTAANAVAVRASARSVPTNRDPRKGNVSMFACQNCGATPEPHMFRCRGCRLMTYCVSCERLSIQLYPVIDTRFTYDVTEQGMSKG